MPKSQAGPVWRGEFHYTETFSDEVGAAEAREQLNESLIRDAVDFDVEVFRVVPNSASRTAPPTTSARNPAA
jgi:hypothetical protein